MNVMKKNKLAGKFSLLHRLNTDTVIIGLLPGIILKRDYEGLNWKEIAKKTNELMKPGSFVIFKTDIDVDSLIK